MPLHVLSNTFIKSSWGRTFLVTLVFLVLASSLFWLDYFRTYETEVSVLFVTKETQPAPVVADALSSIMQTLTFALRAEENMSDGNLLPETDSKDQQKSYWNQYLDVKTEKESGILVFQQQADSEVLSKEKASATLKTLMLATNLYYGNDREVELRMIDKPITRVAISNVWAYAVTVLVTGVFLTSLFFGVLVLLTKKRAPKITLPTIEAHIGESVSWIDPQKFVAVKPSNLAFQEETSVASNEKKIVSEEKKVAQKIASAPGNLPIMSGALPQFGIEEVDMMTEETLPEAGSQVIVEEVSEHFDPTAEPTVEEYKRRLNELLKGKSI
jgi:hypothetical protein